MLQSECHLLNWIHHLLNWIYTSLWTRLNKNCHLWNQELPTTFGVPHFYKHAKRCDISTRGHVRNRLRERSVIPPKTAQRHRGAPFMSQRDYSEPCHITNISKQICESMNETGRHRPIFTANLTSQACSRASYACVCGCAKKAGNGAAAGGEEAAKLTGWSKAISLFGNTVWIRADTRATESC